MADPVTTQMLTLREEQQRLEQELFIKEQLEQAGGSPAGLNSSVPDTKSKSFSSRAAVLNRYFDAMSDFPDYHQRREKKLSHIESFSFEQRELTRRKSRSTIRLEEERQRKEAEVHRLRTTQFTANPVPPSTFLPKYEMMVDEWCARKEAVRIAAEDRAARIKEEERPAIEYAEQLQRRKDAERGRKTIPRGDTDAAFAEWQEKHCKQFVARPVPKSVTSAAARERLQKQEEARKTRIEARSAQLLSMAKCPSRMERAASAASRREVKPLEDTTNLVPKSDTEPTKKRSSSSSRQAELELLRRSNPNLTFKPEVRAHIPPFDELWAKEDLAMTQRRQQKPLTQPEEFRGMRMHSETSDAACKARVMARMAERNSKKGSGKSGKDFTAQRLRNMSPSVAAVLLDIDADNQKLKEQRWPYRSQRTRPKSADPRMSKKPPPTFPRATNAHIRKAECAHSKIVNAQIAAKKALEDDAERQKRHKAVTQRVAGYLLQAGGPPNTDAVISVTTKEMMEKTRETTRDRKTALEKIKQEVASRPPLFMTSKAAGEHFATVAEARAATEENVVKVLKQHGLGGTIRQVMESTATGQLNDADPAKIGEGARADDDEEADFSKSAPAAQGNNSSLQSANAYNSGVSGSQLAVDHVAMTDQPSTAAAASASATHKRTRSGSVSSSTDSFEESDD